jgi:hypothetical protein
VPAKPRQRPVLCAIITAGSDGFTLLTGPGFGWGLCFGATKTFIKIGF